MSVSQFIKNHQQRYQRFLQTWKRRNAHSLFPLVMALVIALLVALGLLQVWIGLLPRFLEAQHAQQLQTHKNLQESLRQLESIRGTQNGSIEIRAQKELGMKYPHQEETP